MEFFHEKTLRPLSLPPRALSPVLLVKSSEDIVLKFAGHNNNTCIQKARILGTSTFDKLVVSGAAVNDTEKCSPHRLGVVAAFTA